MMHRSAHDRADVLLAACLAGNLQPVQSYALSSIALRCYEPTIIRPELSFAAKAAGLVLSERTSPAN